MNTRSSRLLLALLQSALLAACAVVVMSHPIFVGNATGQTVTETPPAVIEVWHGIRRLDSPPQKAEERPDTKPVMPLPQLERPAEIQLTPLPELEKPNVVERATVPVAPFNGTKLGKETSTTQPFEESGETGPGIPGTVEEVIAPKPVRTIREPERSSTREDYVPSGTTNDQNVLIQTAGMIGAAILAPLLLLVGMMFLLRRVQGTAGPHIRVEYVGGQQAIPIDQLVTLMRGAWPNPTATGVEPAPVAVALEPEPEEFTAQLFEIGPSYEEQRLMDEEQAKQQELGVLRKLFEDNLKLQNQLREPDAIIA